jgi:hypothetical protein
MVGNSSVTKERVIVYKREVLRRGRSVTLAKVSRLRCNIHSQIIQGKLTCSEMGKTELKVHACQCKVRELMLNVTKASFSHFDQVMTQLLVLPQSVWTLRANCKGRQYNSHNSFALLQIF